MSVRRLMHSCQSGVALIEFAVALPFLLIIFLGMIELANYTLHNQKVDKVANAMADFVTQGATVGVNDLNGFALAVPHIMRPYNFNGTVVFSSAASLNTARPPCPANTPCITWQYRVLGSDVSRIGAPGGAPSLPNGYVIANGQNVIVAEAFLHYTPVLAVSSNFVPAFTATTIYKIAVLKPRQGSLTVLGP
jgi:hypothetical protein